MYSLFELILFCIWCSGITGFIIYYYAYKKGVKEGVINYQLRENEKQMGETISRISAELNKKKCIEKHRESHNLF